MGEIIDGGVELSEKELISRPEREHDADAAVSQVQTALVSPEQHDEGAGEPERSPRSAHRDSPAHQAAKRPGQTCDHVKKEELGPAETVLARHAEDEQHQHVAEDVVEPSVQKCGRHQSPDFALADRFRVECTRVLDPFEGVEPVTGRLKRRTQRRRRP